MEYDIKGLVINRQAFGDMLLGTHAMKLMKKKYPNSYLAMVISETATLTTVESKGVSEMIEILSLQPGVDEVITYGGRCFRRISRSSPFHNRVDFVLNQNEWYSNLGLVASMQTEFKSRGFIDTFNTETTFRTDNPSPVKNENLITTAGELDWNRKIGFTPYKLFGHMEENGYEVQMLGADTHIDSYLTALRKLEESVLYIGPIGSMSHFAAGLDINTINVMSVFPPQYDSPQYYHSGFHRSVLTNRKKDYSMITPKIYNGEEQQPGWGNPRTEKGFWDYVNSDDYYDIERDLINSFDEWLWA